MTNGTGGGEMFPHPIIQCALVHNSAFISCDDESVVSSDTQSIEAKVRDETVSVSSKEK